MSYISTPLDMLAQEDMRARLLIIDPEHADDTPLMPDLILEQDGKIYLEQTGWCFEVTHDNLDRITGEDLRKAMGWQANMSVYLSDIRIVPPKISCA